MRIGIVALLAVVIGAWLGWEQGKLEKRGKDADIAALKAQILALTEGGSSHKAQPDALKAEAAAREAAPEANLKQNSDPSSVLVRYGSLVDNILAYRSSFEADGYKPEKVVELERRAGELRTFVKRWRSGIPSLCDLFGSDNDALEAEPASQDKAPLFATITHLHDKIAARQAMLEQTLQQSQGTPLAATAVRCLQPGAFVTRQEAWKPL
jgi:cell division septum initiation protein DivIVA